MMSPLSATQIRPPDLRRSPKVGATAAVILLLLVLLAAGQLVSAPSFVDQVSVVNRTPFDLNVQVSDAHSGDGMLLTVAQPNQTTPVSDVVDQGSTWLFTFSRGGVAAGSVRVTRSQLESQHWQVVIPASLDARLLANGQQPAG
jgi:hypothetical protein